jgi:hypothetical protein
MTPATPRTLLALLSKFPVEVIGGEPCFVVADVPGPGSPLGQLLIPIASFLLPPRGARKVRPKPQTGDQLELFPRS